MTKQPSLTEIAVLFLKLGSTAFGGPAAHLAMMEEELVRRRGWISHQDFLDLISAANFIPGPNSTEVAIHVGHKLAGWKGLVVAGTTFIVPAFFIVWAVAWFYVQFSTLPQLQSIFIAVKPVIIAVIAQAVWSLAKSAIKDTTLAFLAGLSLALFLMGQNELLILFSVALANLIFRWPSSLLGPTVGTVSTGMFLKAERVWAQVLTPDKVSMESLFFYFAKVGSVLFGSGYVLIAFLQKDLVDHYQWISQQQLIDAIAVGQLTPGPVFTTATFIGYLISGNSGAIAATLGIFLPAFFFVALSAPLIPRLRRSQWTGQILDGLNVASLALMLGAAILLGKQNSPTLYTVSVFLLSAFLLLKYKVNSAWLIVGAGLMGSLGLAQF